ncbi:hypothetical protein XppCFBP6982P_10890 [Xanthomonas phaseoli pv. phaseoli]|uniref:YcgL domain-containing protein n=1 Tax=Xanthomonas campestris pv. phaseoli TaxID=317013 RepID=A0AB38E6U1_XANCH|nr:hypothetical protein XppCFBP6982P_10890 [Xanthomonas phaseoli pv. phaseoli]AZU15340.1 hypothetical protein AC609_22325 [Xanthomonas phaseoli pv. phaseoli]AZU36865.1 hypothetical protein AC610_22315 [Xanthomonas phaseoli pv. phaseoli]SON77301.1 hypothetical protein XAP6984_130005 [Xanthomonas phaseoli pv. phaseoli]SON92854.1 hypothetical protein XAP7430_90006 [Xanthomonas phaseoli pv. phaseoli]
MLLIDISESTIFHGHEMSRKPWAYQSELAVRPPIAVVDEATFIQQNLKPSATTQDLEQLLLRSEQAATTLTENGYLVLRKNQVFSSPAEIEAKP